MTYLDYAASTPADPAVTEAVASALRMTGNPSSIHAPGRAVRVAVDSARTSVARLFGVGDAAVTFTSGATEANALAVIGSVASAVKGRAAGPFRILTSPLEHASVRTAVTQAARTFGLEVDVMPVGRNGCVDARAAAALITPTTVLVTLTWANNVLGTVQPVAELGAAVVAERRRRGAGDLPLRFHSDAAQALSTLDVRLSGTGIDLLTVSAHKAYGPKGIGALIRSDGAAVEPLYGGGGQEEGLRSGTENVIGIVGFGAAASVLHGRREADAAHASALRARLVDALASRAPRASAFGTAETTLPGTAFVVIRGVPGDRAAMLLDAAGIAVSAGSACDAGARKPSSALDAAIGPSAAAHGGVRVSFGRFTTERDIDECVAAIAKLD